jgi:hypothetical protein
MTYHHAALVKHHDIGVKDPVPFGDTGSDEIDREREAAL